MTATTEQSGTSAIRPFHVDIPQGALEDLRRRIATVRWPSRELVTDRSQGVQLATIQELAGNLTRDHILDNITTYWLTATGASAARSYWEAGQATARAADQAPAEVSLPVAYTTFPGEIFRAPLSWVEKSYPNLIYYNEVDSGGHFAAWEEPELFATELRAAFRTLR